MEFLGYDFATSYDFYSAIPDDLLLEPEQKHIEVPIYQSLVECWQLLNENKLFKNENDILTYIDRRNKVIASDIEWTTGPNSVPMHLIEPDGDFCIFHLSEVIGDF
jgi:hypothetical protein